MTVTYDKISICPECGSEEVTSEYHQMFMVNSGEHYCHSMKTHDSDSPSSCLACGWGGKLWELVEVDDPKAKVKEDKERKQYEKLKAKYG